ncbi:uncharacterized protein LOC134229980 [Saccostrea cucullata]|uniref:uncharacterized protein LOC134229980 n=1 Tax=Saccostrea cuccullata TaxID=36930 RepID=UPI002ED44A1B
MFMEFPVPSCPWHPDSWREAGVKLNCSRDQFGRILYQCAPNEGKTSLVEFCLKGSVARIEKGLCVDSLSNGFLGVQNCSHFDYGCPNRSYINNEIYKYPACLEINTDEHCYVADPSCPNIFRVQENTTDYFTKINGPTTASTATALQMSINLLAVFGSTIVVLGILIGLILFYRRRGHISKQVTTG